MAIIPKSTFLLIIGVVTTLFSIALAIPGTAGFYRKEYYVPTVCYGKKPQGNLLATSDHLGGDFNCGTLLNVTCIGKVPSPCTGKSVVVKVVDNCPGCGPSEHVTMDISEDAYRIIANPIVVQGHVSIDYVK
ncbi:hypothetical protein MTR67_029840 [Solanum verrucosum]|uniref:Expansin-like EG45 domain-containing protein n=2 Tax=Solanum verrucosum TaxID=315347 RepID=A0AAF0R8X1_SOLVR|nr:hypothetical protein MTR67_029840 [Solanum verrucosum]